MYKIYHLTNLTTFLMYFYNKYLTCDMVTTNVVKEMDNFLLFFLFYFGWCSRLRIHCCQLVLTASFRVHVNIVSLLTYLLTY